MQFAQPQFLWLLLVIPPAVALFLLWGARTRRKLRERFIPPRLLPQLLAGWSPARQRARILVLTAACALLLVALARPQWGYTWEEVRQRGLDIVVAVDVSRSMLTADVAPNRLARAKMGVQDLLRIGRTDRFGLVAFAGSAILLCPLTWDDTVFRQSLDALEVGTVSDTGTHLAAALETALRAFQEDTDNYRAIVLLSDGEDHEGGALEAARRVAARGVRIFTVGVGTPEGELLRVRDRHGREDYVRDAAGNVVKSRLNEALLQQIAAVSEGGFYLPLQGPRAMETLYERGLAPLPRREGTERFVRRYRERYHWPLALALVLLATEWVWPQRRRSSRDRGGAGVAAAATAWLVLASAGSAVAVSPAHALREYEAGRYDAARQEFERLLEKRPRDERLHFNAGAAAYRQGAYDQAARHFDQATRSEDLRLQEWAYYNRGNSLYRLGEAESDPARRRALWQEALQQYLHALQLNTNNVDARYNHEFVQRRLEELPPPPPQPQGGGNSREQQPQEQDRSGSEQGQDSQQDRSSTQPNEAQAQETPGQPPQPTGSDQPKPSGSETEGQAESTDPSASGSPPSRPMTPAEARQLLESLKGDERLLQLPPQDKGRPTTTRGKKDW
ncbi:MAG: VWA domain-containing protein [Limisphaera sp.]